MQRNNNFNLIRLLAAVQVMIIHSNEHLNLQMPLWLHEFISIFPGVPIFFTISGFLIYQSFERKGDVREYFFNRAKRIFPALWVCLLFSILVFVAFDAPKTSDGKFAAWLASQVTFFQIWTPSEWKNFAAGSPNGSLWTIPIEVQFYIFVPLFFFIVKSKWRVRGLVALFVLSYAYNVFAYEFKEGDESLYKTLVKNLAPYLFYFIFGVFIYIYYNKISEFIKSKGLYWLSGYVLYYYTFNDVYSIGYFPNIFGLIGVAILSAAIISMAYTFPNVTRKLMGDTDISYGIYLYHMPVVNVIILLGLKGDGVLFLTVSIVATVLATLSWHYIENPCLRLKYRAFQNFNHLVHHQ